MKLQVGDWVICTVSNVVGRIVKFYTPTASEEQIMVMTRDGKRYHAPARTWKHYHFGNRTAGLYIDEHASLLNTHGQYAAKFADNHGICIDAALEHPTVKAHKEYLNKKFGILGKI